MLNWLNNKSRMKREFHVRFCERLEGKFLWSTLPDEDAELNRHFIEHKSNYELATHIVYTEGAKPDETLAEVLKKIGKSCEPVMER